TYCPSVSEGSHELPLKGKLTMDKTHLPLGTLSNVPSNRQLPWVRISLLALFLAFSLASLHPMASARCDDRKLQGNKVNTTSHRPRASAQNAPPCEQLLVECLANGG